MNNKISENKNLKIIILWFVLLLLYYKDYSIEIFVNNIDGWLNLKSYFNVSVDFQEVIFSLLYIIRRVLLLTPIIMIVLNLYINNLFIKWANIVIGAIYSLINSASLIYAFIQAARKIKYYITLRGIEDIVNNLIVLTISILIIFETIKLSREK